MFTSDAQDCIRNVRDDEQELIVYDACDCGTDRFCLKDVGLTEGR